MLTALAGDLLAERTGAMPARVVALPGWMRSAGDFAPIVDGLDAVSIHLPGFGTTAAPDAAWGSLEYANAVASALEGSPPVVLVGHSFGGRVAVRLAATRPELVSGVVLTGVPLVRLVAAPRPKLGFRVIRSLARLRLVSPHLLENYRRRYGSADYNAATGVVRDILVKVVGETYVDDLARVRVPVRMVWGENDTAAPADAGRAAAEMIPDASFRVVAGAGHLLEGDVRVAVREELLTLLKEVGS